MTVFENHRVIHHHTTQSLGIQLKVVIYWWLDNNLIAWVGEGEVSLVDASNYPRGISYPLTRDVPFVLLPSQTRIAS